MYEYVIAFIWLYLSSSQINLNNTFGIYINYQKLKKDLAAHFCGFVHLKSLAAKSKPNTHAIILYILIYVHMDMFLFILIYLCNA